MALKSIFRVVKISLLKHSLSNTLLSMYRSHLHLNIAYHRILWTACGCFDLLVDNPLEMTLGNACEEP